MSKSGEGLGGKFNGPSIKFILREEKIIDLNEILPTEGSPFISFLRSIRSLHEVCTARELKEYNTVLSDFQVDFEYLYKNFKLNMSLKTHIVLHHYRDYFDWTGKTFMHTNGEFVESTHYSIKNEDRTHNFKVKRVIGTPVHREKILKSIIWHNSHRVGFK